MELANANDIAIQLMTQHGLGDWSFKFNRNKRRLGVCKQTEKLIELSEYYVLRNSASHVIDTLLHEIAHAIVGTEHGHDEVWKDMCVHLGCTPQSCSNNAVMPEGYWQAKCPCCCNIFTRHRRPRRLRGRYCVACGPDEGQLVFRDMRVIKTPKPERHIYLQPEAPKQLLLKFLFG